MYSLDWSWDFVLKTTTEQQVPEKKIIGEDEEENDEHEEEFVLEQSPVDMNSSHLYELFAVVIHRGSSAGA